MTRNHLEAYRIIIYYQVPSFKIQADTFIIKSQNLKGRDLGGTNYIEEPKFLEK